MRTTSLVRSALIGAIAFAASVGLSAPAAAQADPGLDAPGGTIEVVLAPRARKALAEGGGWKALGRGLEARFAGARAGAEGSAGIPVVVHAAVVNRDGRVLKHHRSDPVVIEPGEGRSLDRIAALGAEWRLPTMPAAAYFPTDTYFPGDQWYPGSEWLPGPEWDARHTVTDPDRGREREPRGPGVSELRGGDEAVASGDDASDEVGERGVGINPGRVDRRGVGIEPGRSDERGVGIDPGRFLVITLVPAEPGAHERVEVRPLVVDLDAAPGDKPDW